MRFGGGGKVESGLVGRDLGQSGAGEDGASGGGRSCRERRVEADLGGEVGEGGAELRFAAGFIGEVEEGVDVRFGLFVGEDEVEELGAELDGGAIGGTGALVKFFLTVE